MTRSHVREQLPSGKNFLVCPDHKTADELGEVVKYLSPSTCEALRHYLELPIRDGEPRLLFAPVRGAAVTISGMLRCFGLRYLPQTQPPGVNLLRKRFTMAVLNLFKNSKVLSALEEVDKHSAETALRNYAAMTFEQQADAARAMYLGAMGEPPSWPDEPTILDGAVETLDNSADSPPENGDDTSDESDNETEIDLLQPHLGNQLVLFSGAEGATPCVQCEASDANPQTRGRKRYFDEVTQAWIRSKRNELIGSNAVLRQIMRAGRADGVFLREDVLNDNAFIEKLRNVCRKAVQDDPVD